ncbi:MAG: helix-turn-helix transcriptional regulator [Bacteroidetes bacterium]|nr:helix-turn-helix transcriptional regulator [Bacteroidota bacterium]
MVSVYDFLQSQGEDYKKLSFKELLFVHYRCPQIEQYVKVYTHLNFIVYALDGKKAYHTPFKTYRIEKGESVFIRRGGYLQERFFDNDWKLIAFFMPDSYLFDFIKEYRTSLPFDRSTPSPLEVFTPLYLNDMAKVFFDSMLPYFVQHPAPPESLVELKFRELLLTLLSSPQNRGLLHYLGQLADSGRPMLRDIMEENFMYNMSLEEYARLSRRSLAGFKREFKDTFHISPGKWLIEKRLLYARSLITTTQKTIAEIVDESGFENTTHFSKVFKERFGIPPLKFRKSSTTAPPIPTTTFLSC